MQKDNPRSSNYPNYHCLFCHGTFSYRRTRGDLAPALPLGAIGWNGMGQPIWDTTTRIGWRRNEAEEKERLEREGG